MKKITQENIMAVLLLVVFGAFAVATMSYGDRARLVPLPVAVFSMGMVFCQLVVQNFLKANFAVDAKEIFTKSTQKNISSVPSKVREKGGKEWLAIVIVSGFLVLILVLGLNLGILLFVIGYFSLVNKSSFLSSVIFGVVTWSAIYLLFSMILGVRFYQGLLLQLL